MQCNANAKELVYHSELVYIIPLSQSLWTLKREGKGAVEGAGVPCEGVV